MTDFVVVDFETANEMRGSPCAVGYCTVSGVDVTGSGSFLIRPPEFRFADFNVGLHGITPEMCSDALPWSDALAALESIVGGALVVAHYAPFDIGVIRDASALSEVVVPELRFACTRQLARLTWPELGSYSLPDVVDFCGTGPFRHHDARDDALAAASIAITATRQRPANTLLELLDDLQIGIGTLLGGLYNGSTGPGQGHRLPRTPSDQAVIDPGHPFYEKKIVFTGGLLSMPRPLAQQAVVDVGGRAMSSVGKKTNFLVVGGEFHGLLQGHQSHKLEECLSLRAQGQDIELLDEVDFLALLRGGA